jgi:hypothetical protein
MTTYRVPFEVELKGKGPEMKELKVVANSPHEARARAEKALHRQYGDKAKVIGLATRYIPPPR